MGIKVSDIMLDLATGDASIHDAYIQEAVGQVKVSAAIYDAATKIASLNDNDRAQIVQEAADAGLPSDKEGSINLAYEAVERELIGTCRHLYAESAKMTETVEKKTNPYGAVNALAKACGVKKSVDYTPDYAVELASAVVKNKDIDLSNGERFCKGSVAKKLTKNYIQGVSLVANAFGVDTDEIFNDDAVKSVVAAPVTAKAAKKEDGTKDCCLSYMTDTLANANKYLSGNEIKSEDFATKISKSDLAAVITCDFAAIKVAAFIKKRFGENGDKLEKMISKAVKKCQNNKKIVAAAGEANECSGGKKPDIVAVNEGLDKTTKALIGAFNDSIMSLMNSQN